MKNIATIIFIILLMTGTALAQDKFTKEDWAREIAWGTLHLIDLGQTLNIAKDPKHYHEINPILGKHPKVGDVYAVFIFSAFAHPVVSYLLPNPYRKAFQYVTIGMTGMAVINNFSIGLRLDF